MYIVFLVFSSREYKYKIEHRKYKRREYKKRNG